MQELLERNWWGILSTMGETHPYAVPVVYGYDGEHFYIASRSGRKIDHIEIRSGVCLNVVEVGNPGDHWTSVLITGQAELVGDAKGHLAAILALRRQAGITARNVDPRDLARMAAARVIRVLPTEMTGRARTE
jgi:nitroimidazol reductase NimA-like FMN-containing flavoprotein (pyridoxamine 5'-phosphate oxidase superfamily)